MRACFLVLTLLAATPAFSEAHNHGSHLAEVEGLRVLHVWTAATPAGSDALIYMEIENTSASEAMLTGGEAQDHALELVGFTYTAAGDTWTVLPSLPVPAGAELHLEPKVLALRWSDIPASLEEGADVDIEIEISGYHLAAEVEVGAANATAHSHAGHNH